MRDVQAHFSRFEVFGHTDRKVLEGGNARRDEQRVVMPGVGHLAEDLGHVLVGTVPHARPEADRNGDLF